MSSDRDSRLARGVLAVHCGEDVNIIRIGPHTHLNIFVIEGNTEADRQTPMWGRGRIDHFGLQVGGWLV